MDKRTGDIAGRGPRSVQVMILLVVSLLVFLAAPAAAWATGTYESYATYTDQEKEFVGLLNAYRVANGRDPLLVSDVLSKAATKHNLDMAKYKFFSHVTVASDYFAKGSEPWDRMRAVGYNFNTTMAENLAGGQSTAAEAFNAWKTSAGHNKIMLEPSLKVIGVSMDFVPGTSYGWYWTTDFGGYVDGSSHGFNTTPPPDYTTIVGSNRYETAIMVSKKAFPAGAPTVFIAKGDNFPDALAAAPLAAAYEGPVILTPSSGLTQAIKDELVRLKPYKVFYIGLPETFEQAIRELLPEATVKAVRGKDRYETATFLADELKNKTGTVTKVVVAPGDKFPDALSAAPLAAAKGWAILLTPQSGAMPEVTVAKIKELGVSSALVVGTSAKLPQTIKDVVYKVGKDRYDTSAQIAVYAKSQGLYFALTALATGENYPDALVVGPYLVQGQGVVLLTRQTGVPSYIQQLLTTNREDIDMIEFVGLPSTVVNQTKMLLQ